MENYEINKIIGKGNFGTIYLAKNKHNGKPVAVKTEPHGQPVQSIKHEAKMMNYLFRNKTKNLPMIYWYGNHKNHICLVMTYYECSLDHYVKQMTENNSQPIMVQCIDIFEYIHKYFVLHRDIKPNNFMIKNHEIFLIDFGMSTFYVDENGEHLPNVPQPTILGSPKYVSYNNHMGHTISRRDELISIGYMYMSFFGTLPWQNIQSISSQKSYIDIHHESNILRKKYKSLEFIFMNLKKPYYSERLIHIIKNYMNYCYSLKYDEEPNYHAVQSLFS